MKKTVQCGLVAGLISAGMLLDAAGGLPKVSDANRETVRIMKNIKIPPSYTPTYQPATWQQYVPPAGVTPDYSPKVRQFTATNVTNAMVTNIPIVDKAVKTTAPTVTPGKEKTPSIEKK